MKGNFQLIILVVFLIAAVFGIFVFSGAIPIGNKSSDVGAQGTVILWGTIKANVIAPILENFNRANPSFVVKYVEKDAETFDQELLEALASGQGPDMFFLPDPLAFHYKNKIYTIPYASYPLSSFQNAFAGAGESFLTSKGILAFPMAIDPMVMYYNRSILDTNNIVYSPTTWEELQKLVPTLTRKDNAKKIDISAVALGQFTNVNNAKEIISLLLMQSGSKILKEKDGLFVSDLKNLSGVNLGNALSFYTNFSDPLKEVYSWNKSLPSSLDAFTSGNLVFYFGYASELPYIIKKNPNLNFSLAPVPQVASTSSKLTATHIMGIAISAFSKNLNTALTASSLMAVGDFAKDLTSAIGIAPARRDLLALKPTDSYLPIIYSSALYGKGWLDPSAIDTNTIFRGMVEGILSNQMSADVAVRDASDKLDSLLIKFNGSNEEN